MKNLDLRSTMIGFLSCLCLFLIMGQTSGIKEYDTLKVNKLIIDNEAMKSTTILNGFSIRMTEDKSKGIKDNIGLPFDDTMIAPGFMTLADPENRVKNNINSYSYVIKSENSNPANPIVSIVAGNKDPELKFYGVIEVFNKHGEQTAYMGNDTDQHGLIQLFDKYGDFGRQLSGKN